MKIQSCEHIQPKAVDWLWRRRIPCGAVTVLVADPGMGKSTLVAELAALISRGGDMPDGPPTASGSVLLINGEDDLQATTVPRLIAAGADRSRVLTMAPEGKAWSVADVSALRLAIEGVHDLRMIVVDPIGSYMGARTNTHRDNEVRRDLQPLADLARDRGLAVVLVAHRRKTAAGGGGGLADDAVLGSKAFTGLARTVLHLRPHPEVPDHRVLLAGKNNLSRKACGLTLRIVDKPDWRLPGEPPGMIEWLGENDLTADDLEDDRQTRQRSAPAVDKAVEFVRDVLSAGEVPAADLERRAREAGIASKTLQRARDRLGVKPRKLPSMGSGWMVGLSEGGLEHSL